MARSASGMADTGRPPGSRLMSSAMMCAAAGLARRATAGSTLRGMQCKASRCTLRCSKYALTASAWAAAVACGPMHTPATPSVSASCTTAAGKASQGPARAPRFSNATSCAAVAPELAAVPSAGHARAGASWLLPPANAKLAVTAAACCSAATARCTAVISDVLGGNAVDAAMANGSAPGRQGGKTCCSC